MVIGFTVVRLVGWVGEGDGGIVGGLVGEGDGVGGLVGEGDGGDVGGELPQLILKA